MSLLFLFPARLLSPLTSSRPSWAGRLLSPMDSTHTLGGDILYCRISHFTFHLLEISRNFLSAATFLFPLLFVDLDFEFFSWKLRNILSIPISTENTLNPYLSGHFSCFLAPCTVWTSTVWWLLTLWILVSLSRRLEVHFLTFWVRAQTGVRGSPIRPPCVTFGSDAVKTVACGIHFVEGNGDVRLSR